MQTFLPHASFVDSVVCLDNKRLGKQRVEALQILHTLQGHTSGWKNHPAVKMWKGYEPALVCYYNACLDEWERRGFRNIKLKKLEPYDYGDEICYPPFIGNKAFHDSHKSKLLQKNFKHYSQFDWDVQYGLSYVWPTRS